MKIKKLVIHIATYKFVLINDGKSFSIRNFFTFEAIFYEL